MVLSILFMLMDQHWEKFVLHTVILLVYILPDQPVCLIICGRQLEKILPIINLIHELLVKQVERILLLHINLQIPMWLLLLCYEVHLNTRDKNVLLHQELIFLPILQKK